VEEVETKDVLPVIRLSVRISRPVEEVWEKFLDPLVMIQWLGNEISADFREGGAVRFLGEYAPATGEIENFWTLKKFKEEKVILFSWGILGSETLFILRFREVPTGTLLDVRHGAIPIAAKDFHMSEHWNLLLANFKAILELGEEALRFKYTEYRPHRITRYDPTEIRISVLCRVPPQLPFDVWTNPEKLKHFIRADEPIIDRQYAGIYTWWAEGKGPVVFTKMIQDQELEFTWVFGDEPETKVNIRFDPVEDNTLVTLNHYEFRSPEAVIGYDIGWTSILAELKLVCELGESGISRHIDWE
jgi:uncharacterized protein YndB with AHSA1/START domain